MVAIALGICKKAPRAEPARGARVYNRAMQAPAPRIPWLTMALVAVLAFGGGIGLSWWQGQRGDHAAIDGLMWPDPPRVPAFDLVDQDGKRYTLDELKGRWTLVFFGFTHCPDVCPTTLQILAQVHRNLKNDPRYAERGQVLFVSLDPARDTPAQIAQYVHYFSPEMRGVTGPETELLPLTRALGVLFMKVAQGDKDYTVDHSAGIFFIDPQARLVSVLTPPHTADSVIARFAAVSAFIEARS